MQQKGCIYNPGSAPAEAELRQRVVVCQGFLVPCRGDRHSRVTSMLQLGQS